MRVALCATCLVDQFFPEVGEATVKVLRHLGVDVAFPEAQTCCGQIGFNGGYRKEAADVARHFVETFEPYDHIVAPSGSCSSMIKVYYPELFADDPDMLERATAVGEKTHEFSDFIVNVLGVTEVGGVSTGLVTYHDACHLLRELGISEEPRTLIQNTRGVELQEMPKSDACCGFGGLFSVKFPEISTAILNEKVGNIEETGASTLVANDCGCLMQIRGALQRKGSKVRPKHIAELLAEGLD
ncbi:MAG: (Fe-S)-binding protein [Chloroflexi bacterium]|nr:(Fe-S)-binding protein [Chloroflexota bacterium]MDA1174777.1 (Fe-S)-binding protein [Chloroflexota bacterium]